MRITKMSHTNKLGSGFGSKLAITTLMAYLKLIKAKKTTKSGASLDHVYEES